MSGDALAVTIDSTVCTVQTNTMRFDCNVELSESATVRIGFKPTSGALWNWSNWAIGDDVDFVLYNFVPDTTYEYKVEVDGGPTSRARTLTGGPTLPEYLDELYLQYFIRTGATPASNYVMFDTPDCQLDKNYLVIVDVSEQAIVWYQDVEEVSAGSEITGWSYTTDKTILVSVDKAYVYEWNLDGSVERTISDFESSCLTASGDEGPCPHHDVFRSADNGKTYVMTGSFDDSIAPADTDDYDAPSACDSYDGFVDDGFREYNTTFTAYADHSLMADMGYDPSVDGGPNPQGCLGDGYWSEQGFDSSLDVVDWTHSNSVSVVQPGSHPYANISLRQWSQILRYDIDDESVEWKIYGPNPANATYSDFTLAAASGISATANFGGQHHLTEDDGLFLMFDNRDGIIGGDPTRAIQFSLDHSSNVATIVRNWRMRTPTYHTGLNCSRLGSAVLVPGTSDQHVLANCGPSMTIQEIDEYDGGNTTDPVLQISLDNTTPDLCEDPVIDENTNPSADPARIYRAWPLLMLGEF
jgi:hypothetical protein